MPIVSLLDNDLYKFSMQQAIMRCFPDLEVEYTLIIRKKRQFPDCFDHAILGGIGLLSELSLTKREEEFLENRCPFLSPMYIDYLRGYRFDPAEVKVIQQGDQIKLKIRGYWFRTVLWEVPLMALISEMFFEGHPYADRQNRCKNNTAKAEEMIKHGLKVACFSTRRRHSYRNQREMLTDIHSTAPKNLIGTSNVHFAMDFDTRPIGTQAHEWFMAIAALFGYRMANRIAMEKWVEVYEGSLGIALTDTYTTDVFFNDFTTKYAKLFDGVRQDSGSPIEFAEKAINHYKSLGIDPTTKAAIFSDSLDIPAAVEIHKFCDGRIRDSYGIGTNLSNDVGVEPLNMVIKLTGVKVNGTWVPTVKLSDDVGKHTGPPGEVNLCMNTLRMAP